VTERQDEVEAPDYRSLPEWLVLKVINGVRKGTFVPGERMLEKDLASRFGVSRAPVRDAMHRLENLGVLERPGPRGFCVTHWTADDRIEVLAIVDALILTSIQLALDRLTEEDFAALDAIVASMRATLEATGTVPDLSSQDALFHRIIAVASGNRRLLQLLDNLSVPLGLYGGTADYYSPEEWLSIHSALLDTLKLRDEDAAVAQFWKNRRETMDILLRSSRDTSD
jgi:DNA-binding GntR family transcriptional regulator